MSRRSVTSVTRLNRLGSVRFATIGSAGRYTADQRSLKMDRETKHEIVVLSLSTLAALPVVTALGLAVVTGIMAW